MAKNKGMKVCTECGNSVKPENYDRHMRNVHGAGVKNRKNSSKDRKKRIEQERLEQSKRMQQQKMLVAASIIVVVIVVGVVAIMFFNSGGHEGYQPTDEIPNPSGSETVVTVPISSVTDTAKFYTYDTNGVIVRYFLVRGGDNQIHLATDACDVCYDAKKGYRQNDDDMTCNNCGQSFPINSIGTENTQGGCWPSYIPIALDSGNVIIQKSDLGAKRYMFD